MKTLYAAAVITLVLFATAFTCADSSTKKITVNNNANNGFAVVELFTSEGCSSCPPADKAVANLLKQYSNVYVLGYHVDYWDDLGWKDAFSSSAFTQRQRDYARVFKLGSVYTPQVVMNGEEEFVGSDESKLHASIDKDLKEQPQQNLSVNAKANNNKIDVTYQTNAVNSNLNIALIQLTADTRVQRGENRGATLHHVNIVRNLQTVSVKNNSGSVSLNLPEGLPPKDCEVIAFAQDANNFKIKSAAKATIQ